MVNLAASAVTTKGFLILILRIPSVQLTLFSNCEEEALGVVLTNFLSVYHYVFTQY